MRIAAIATHPIPRWGPQALTFFFAATALARTVEVRLARAPAGIESALPRGGAYGRALEAVRAAHYRRAGELLLEARAEVRRAGDAGTLPPERARSLGLKCEWEALQVDALLRATRESANLRAFDRLLAEATALHNLFLTSRAFHGEGDAVVYQRATHAYQAALRLAASENVRDEFAVSAIEGYAGLLAAGGHRRQSLGELQRIPADVRMSENNLLATAHVYAETSQPERALAALSLARDTMPSWPELKTLLRIANDYDALRDDPRFLRLVGEEE